MTPDLTEATIPTLSRPQLVAAQAKLSAVIAGAAAMAMRISAELSMRPEATVIPERLLSTGEAAKMLGISEATLRARRAQQPWISFRVEQPGRHPHYHAGKIAAYMLDPHGYMERLETPLLSVRRGQR